MTESDWLQSGNIWILVEYLRTEHRVARTKAGRRRLRLFSCACVRGVWHLLSNDQKQFIETAERFAEGQVSRTVMQQTQDRALQGITSGWSGFTLVHHLATAVYAAIANGNPAHMATSAAQASATAESRWILDERMGEGARYSEAEVPSREALFAAHARHLEILRDIFGNPFRALGAPPAGAEVRGVAQAIAEGDLSAYPILADALADRGADEAAAHCRQGLHVRGCHLIDWVLGHW